MGMFTKLLSLFVVGAAHIIFPTVRAVDCGQLHAAVFAVQTSRKEVDMFSLAPVLAVMAAVLHLKEQLHGIVIKYFRVVVRENILLVSGNLFVFTVDGHPLSFVGSQYPVMIIVKERIFYHAVAPHMGDFPVIGQAQGLVAFLLQHGRRGDAPV